MPADRTIRVQGMCLVGTEAHLVTVQARFEPGDRGRTEVVLTGLPDAVLRESRSRLCAALEEHRLHLPRGRLYLHLAPAGLRKTGEALDLPLALGAATATGHLPPGILAGTLFLGELGIDGRLRDVPGGLAGAELAARSGLGVLVAPPRTAREAACLAAARGAATEAAPEVGGKGGEGRSPRVLAAGCLGEVVGWLASGEGLSAPPAPPTNGSRPGGHGGGLDLVRGQGAAKRALAVAAAGGHGLLLSGPPGTGKSLLARGLGALLAPPTLEERLALTRVASATGTWTGALVEERPFRAPHHSTTLPGLVGGGQPLVPGEITRAHQGLLFLDELPEFRRDALEALRQPLESGRVLLARAGRRLELPAAFRLVTAMNPCPCGFRGHPVRPCRCSPHEVRRYRRRISGPLLDRIELRVEVPAPALAELGRQPPEEEREATLARRVARALERARARQGARPNARLDADDLDRFTPWTAAQRRLLQRAGERRALSARAVQGLRRVARTLADLGDADAVDADHLAGALHLRAPLLEDD
jgi:magnesium chelatase family protein